MHLALCALLALAPAAGNAQSPPPPRAGPNGPNGLTGLWLNPAGSVAVQVEPCADALCGHVVWASEEAKADARDSGVTALLGTAVLEQYRPTGARRWAGTVYVPDMGHHFDSTIEAIGPDVMRVRGCVLHRLLCRSQDWNHIARLPQ
ncbi:DUF2147 domain-containing protein [Novosphingobium sp. 1949]|uniref:DUF2147 domain-containing protein n=1 Tax=Novosphingobium organovorum TaxID=2930092 RepID=A0ABT0BHW2_9SPHN|nr:DUF2147 domain-containing protein [Novosphingobium organovorum]MCJ2184629.1 DUF2147 domain-containing protein [Novosphingobium organovorum]